MNIFQERESAFKKNSPSLLQRAMRGRNRRLCLGLGRLAGTTMVDLVGDGGSQEDGRERTEEDTEQHRKREGANGFTTEEEDAEEHQEGGERSHDGTRQRVVDGVIEHTLRIAVGIESVSTSG